MYLMLSIHPEYAEKIFDGTKKWEYRKKVPRGHGREIKGVVVYATAPSSKLLGEFTTDFMQVQQMATEVLWRRTCGNSVGGIAKSKFDEYFKGHEYGYAIPILETFRYATPGPTLADFGVKAPPQGWVYLRDYTGVQTIK